MDNRHIAKMRAAS